MGLGGTSGHNTSLAKFSSSGKGSSANKNETLAGWRAMALAGVFLARGFTEKDKNIATD